jgi:hypothetical protein
MAMVMAMAMIMLQRGAHPCVCKTCPSDILSAFERQAPKETSRSSQGKAECVWCGGLQSSLLHFFFFFSFFFFFLFFFFLIVYFNYYLPLVLTLMFLFL